MASFQHSFTLAGFISRKRVTFESTTIIYFIDDVFADTISPTDAEFLRQRMKSPTPSFAANYYILFCSFYLVPFFILLWTKANT